MNTHDILYGDTVVPTSKLLRNRDLDSDRKLKQHNTVSWLVQIEPVCPPGKHTKNEETVLQNSESHVWSNEMEDSAAVYTD